MKMKKILSVVSAAALAASMMAISAVSTSAADDYTIYFKLPTDDQLETIGLEVWGSTVTVHAWNDAGNVNGDWPGATATVVDEANGIYSYTWTADNLPTGIIFNNGDQGVQTQNIDGGETIAKSDATKTVANPAIVWGALYEATGEGAEDANGNTNVLVAVTEENYGAADDTAADTTTDDTADTTTTDDTAADTTTTDDTADTTTTDDTASDTTTVATGDTSAAWVLLAVVAASLGTAVVMTKKASKD